MITGERGKARDDILAALARRGWAGRLVWGFAPVQDRHAAPAIVRALGDIAALAEVDVVIVARGGGSLADLLCFCDETLCRTVALLGVPVIASVGHHTDRTLLDDVAAFSCSTPTHAAEAAVGVDCTRARAEQIASGGAPARPRPPRGAHARAHAGRALSRAGRAPRSPARAPAPAAARDPRGLAPAPGRRREVTERRARGAPAQGRLLPAATAASGARASWPSSLAVLAGHDPQRTLERGYALVESESGQPLPDVRRPVRRSGCGCASPTGCWQPR